MINTPAIPVYFKERTYWELVMQAEKMQIGVGKLVSMICDKYVEMLKDGGGIGGKKKVPARG